MTPQPGEALREIVRKMDIFAAARQRDHDDNRDVPDNINEAVAAVVRSWASQIEVALPAPVAGEGLEARIRTLLAETEAGIARAEVNGPNDPEGRYPCWGTVTTERKAFAANLRAALAANQPVAEERTP